jgi:hypothetical protein
VETLVEEIVDLAQTPPGTVAASKGLALSPVPGATDTCYQTLISPRRHRGRWLRAKQDRKREAGAILRPPFQNEISVEVGCSTRLQRDFGVPPD